MRGLLEGQGWKSTQEFVRTTGSELKQHCTRPVPNQNEAKSKGLVGIQLSGWQEGKA